MRADPRQQKLAPGQGVRRRLADPRLEDLLLGTELVGRQVELEAGGQPVPAVVLVDGRLDRRDEDLAAEELAQDVARDAALAAAGFLRRPLVGIVGGVLSPRGADRGLE